MLDLLPVWLLPLMGTLLPILVQKLSEGWRVPAVGVAALATALVAGVVSPIILAANIPFLAWDLFQKLVVGYTVAKVPTSALGSPTARKMLGTAGAVALLFFAYRAWAQDPTAAVPEGDDSAFLLVIISGLFARLSTWIVKKVTKKKPQSEGSLT